MYKTEIKTIVITGPSAIGKTTLAKILLEKYANLSLVTSYTTRPKREEDVNYHHVSIKDFLADLSNDNFAEWSEVYKGVLYGNKWNSLIDLKKEGKIPLLVKNPTGAKTYFESTNCLVINLVPKNPDIIRQRILQLRSDNVEQRLATLDNLDLGFGTEFRFENYFDEVIEDIFLAVDNFMK